MVLPGQTSVSEDAQNKKELAAKNAGTGASPDSPDPLRGILQGFSGDTRVAMNNAMYSGNAESVQRTSSAMNVDTGMGGSAGKEDDAKKNAVYDEIVRQAVQGWDNWKAAYDAETDPFKKYQMAKDKYEEGAAKLPKDAQGNVDWAAAAKKAGVVLSDDVLARREGEDDKAYQERIRHALLKEMFDANGNLKDKYKTEYGVLVGGTAYSKEQANKYETQPQARKDLAQSVQATIVSTTAKLVSAEPTRTRIDSFRAELREISKIESAAERSASLNSAMTRYSDLGTAEWNKNRVTSLSVEEVQGKLQEREIALAQEQVATATVQQQAMKVQQDLNLDEDVDDLLAEIDGAKPAGSMTAQFGRATAGVVAEKPAEVQVAAAASTQGTQQQTLPKFESMV